MTEIEEAFIVIVSIAVVISLFVLYCYHTVKKQREEIESRIRDIKVGDIFTSCISYENPFKKCDCFFFKVEEIRENEEGDVWLRGYSRRGVEYFYSAFDIATEWEKVKDKTWEEILSC